MYGLSTSPAQPKNGLKWEPKVKSLEERRKLRGMKHESEVISSIGFHHIEFYCGDAKTTSQIFSMALGMSSTGSTGQHTGNDKCVSYGLESGDVRFLLTAPYSQQVSSAQSTATVNDAADFDAPATLPGFEPAMAHDFFSKHGLAARAIGIEVKSAANAFKNAVERGAVPVVEPTFVPACSGQEKLVGSAMPGCELAEVELYGDVVLRFISFPETMEFDLEAGKRLPFLPHLAPTGKQRKSFGIRRIDHAVGNVPNLAEALERVAGFTGFHEFAEFTPEDIGTVESGLNSVVLASDSEDVLLPLNEPTEGKYVHRSYVLRFTSFFERAISKPYIVSFSGENLRSKRTWSKTREQVSNTWH